MYYFSAAYFLSIGTTGCLLFLFRHQSQRLQTFTREQWKPIIIGTSTSLFLGGILCICQIIINVQ